MEETLGGSDLLFSAGSTAAAYRVQTEYFEGPMDLLLHLIRKRRMNIMDVRLGEITSEYLAHLQNIEAINPSRESEFLVTAAILVYIKSYSLLPKTEEEGEVSDERQLVNRLVEYEKIQKISQLLNEMEEASILLWRRQEGDESFHATEFTMDKMSAFQLAEIFFSIVKKKEAGGFLTIASKDYSIEQKRQEILLLLEKQGYIDFTEYLSQLNTIEELLVSFFTLLELVRQRKLIVVQKKLFDRIQVWKGASDPAAG